MKDGFLRDPQGRALFLRGVNISNRQKWPPYFDFHTAADFRRLHDEWGLNTVRLLIMWAAIEPTRGAYDSAYLDQVVERIHWARDAGLMIIVDMHQDVYGEGFASAGGDGAPRWTCDESRYARFQPTSPWFANYGNSEVIACYDAFWSSTDLQDRYVQVWRRVAERLHGEDTVIGFDAMNEPFAGSADWYTFEGDLLQPLYERVTRAVRESNPHWIAFLEPAITRGAGVPTSLKPFAVPDVVFAPHTYDPDASRGNGFDPTHRENLITAARQLSEDANALGAALLFGEYGCDPSKPNVAPYMNAQFDAFAGVLAGSTYYHFGRDDSYGLQNVDGTDKADLIALLVRPFPERVAGTPTKISYDADTAAFTLTYRPETSITSPTLITLPPRAYPLGFHAECTGCDATVLPGMLQVKATTGSTTVTVSVRPP